jgi:hypothetical protein
MGIRDYRAEIGKASSKWSDWSEGSHCDDFSLKLGLRPDNLREQLITTPNWKRIKKVVVKIVQELRNETRQRPFVIWSVSLWPYQKQWEEQSRTLAQHQQQPNLKKCVNYNKVCQLNSRNKDDTDSKKSLTDQRKRRSTLIWKQKIRIWRSLCSKSSKPRSSREKADLQELTHLRKQECRYQV